MTDTTAPELLSFSISDTVDLSDGQAALNFSVTTTSDQVGIDDVVVWFEDKISYAYSAGSDNPNGTYSLVTLSGIYDSWDDFTVSEDKWLFPNIASNGTYKIDRVEVTDHAGNETEYSYADLANLGFSNEFEVIGAPAADTTAPELGDFSITTLVDDDVPSILSGFSWNDDNANSTTISYSFPWLDAQEAYFASGYSGNEPYAVEAFGATNEIVKQFEYALSLYENISNIQFDRVIEDGNQVGDIRFAFSDSVEEPWGWHIFQETTLKRAIFGLTLNFLQILGSPGIIISSQRYMKLDMLQVQIILSKGTMFQRRSGIIAYIL